MKLFNRSKQTLIYAACDGEVVLAKDINDDVFSEEMLGKTYGIKPSCKDVLSPIDGKVCLVYPTLHAIGIKSSKGFEILIHIGIDTVNLKGEGFESFVKVGTKVKKGTKLVSFDYEGIAKKGIDTTVITIILNKNNFIVDDIEDCKNVIAATSVISIVDRQT